DSVISINSTDDLLIDGRGGNDSLHGWDGDDTITGGDGNDDLFGREGNDSLSGGTGNDNVLGYGGNDILDGGAGSDTIWGYAGNDTLYVDADDITSGSIDAGEDTVGQDQDVMWVDATTGSLSYNIHVMRVEVAHGG